MISHAPSVSPFEQPSAQNSDEALPLADRTVPAALRRAASRVPDQAALIEPGGRTIVYRELEDEARRAASGLRALGLQPGDTVLAMLDEHADHVIAWLGANIASVPWVPINTAFKGSMLQYMVEHSRARVLVIEGKWVDRIIAISGNSLTSRRSSSETMATPWLRTASSVTTSRSCSKPSWSRWTSRMSPTSRPSSTPQEPRVAPRACWFRTVTRMRRRCPVLIPIPPTAW